MSEKTLCIIKPDAVENNFVDQINEMIESKGLSILKSKKTNISSEIAKKFYAEHSEKPFFNELVDFITSGPAVVQILEGDACIKSYRSLMGATNPEEAEEGTIRKKFAESISKNAVHGSDSPESADREIEIMSALF
ncbi:nucleoside-diphosphate kinase [Gammaproteobacteria bacterium]|nr:nucleoside-diphosphate kinase [Gammaproteobacteria bacterium]